MPAGCNPESKFAVLPEEIAPVFLKPFIGLDLPSFKDDNNIGASSFITLRASLTRGKVTGFSELKIKAMCAVELDKTDAIYYAVKLPELNGEYNKV